MSVTTTGHLGGLVCKEADSFFVVCVKITVCAFIKVRGIKTTAPLLLQTPVTTPPTCALDAKVKL
jgi:hypothetical protein